MAEETGFVREGFAMDETGFTLAGEGVDERQIRAEYARLTRALISRGMSITTMESATGGQIASLITDTEGASAIFKGAYVTYSNEAKIAAGVPEQTISRYSVYSRETARAMAQACRRAFAAHIGIGVTGTMGNVDPANAAASTPGTVYFAFCISRDGREGPCETFDHVVSIAPQETRLAYKLAVAHEVYTELVPLL